MAACCRRRERRRIGSECRAAVATAEGGSGRAASAETASSRTPINRASSVALSASHACSKVSVWDAPEVPTVFPAASVVEESGTAAESARCAHCSAWRTSTTFHSVKSDVRARSNTVAKSVTAAAPGARPAARACRALRDRKRDGRVLDASVGGCWCLDAIVASLDVARLHSQTCSVRPSRRCGLCFRAGGSNAHCNPHRECPPRQRFSRLSSLHVRLLYAGDRHSRRAV